MRNQLNNRKYCTMYLTHMMILICIIQIEIHFLILNEKKNMMYILIKWDELMVFT